MLFRSVNLDRSPRRAWLLGGIALGMLGGYEFAVFVAPQIYPVWLTTLMAICFLVVISYRLEVEVRTSSMTRPIVALQLVHRTDACFLPEVSGSSSLPRRAA